MPWGPCIAGGLQFPVAECGRCLHKEHMPTKAEMNQFLEQISQAHPDEFIIMVVDGASSQKSLELRVPENIRLHSLPGYSPELNTKGQVGDELREKEFSNRVFGSMAGVISQLEAGLPRMAGNTQPPRSLTAWPWIVSLTLKAN